MITRLSSYNLRRARHRRTRRYYETMDESELTWLIDLRAYNLALATQ